MICCYIHVPLIGAFLYFHFIIEANNVWKMIGFDVMFLAPFCTIGSLALTDILRLPLSSTWIIVYFFILPLVYFIGWVTIVHYNVNRLEYGMAGTNMESRHGSAITLSILFTFSFIFFKHLLVHLVVYSCSFTISSNIYSMLLHRLVEQWSWNVNVIE